MKPCPDCKSKLSPIQIIDQRGNAKVAVGFQYTRGEAPKTSVWSGKIQNSAGTVQAFICDGCHRVFLYADPA